MASSQEAPWGISVYIEPFSFLEAFSFLEFDEQKMEQATRLLGATEAYHTRFQMGARQRAGNAQQLHIMCERFAG
jgi:hypothetical protein